MIITDYFGLYLCDNTTDLFDFTNNLHRDMNEIWMKQRLSLIETDINNGLSWLNKNEDAGCSIVNNLFCLPSQGLRYGKYFNFFELLYLMASETMTKNTSNKTLRKVEVLRNNWMVDKKQPAQEQVEKINRI